MNSYEKFLSAFQGKSIQYSITGNKTVGENVAADFRTDKVFKKHNTGF